MKLSDNTVKLIIDATNIATILGIDGIILDEKGIRGYNDVTAVLISSFEDFKFEFPALGISRLQSLKHKFKLLESDSSFQVSFENKGDTDIVEKLVFNSNAINFEFRCALPRSITDISKKINKTPVIHFEVSDSDIDVITRAAAAMRTKTMTIQYVKKGIRFRFSEDSGDILNFSPSSKLTDVVELQNNLSLTISLQKALQVFKLAAALDGSFRLNILKNNIVYVDVNGIDVFIMPEV
jgi:hypothetical protein